ncbi:MAG: hypothetical protein LBV28_03180, partial [Puniceicoccales bacterium]|nr:hypothetical protein [Puniceicoccales bacterium]
MSAVRMGGRFGKTGGRRQPKYRRATAPMDGTGRRGAVFRLEAGGGGGYVSKKIMRLLRLFVLTLPVLFWGIGAGLFAQPVANTQVTLLADHAVVTPGQKLQLGLRLVSQAGWHTYGKDPGDAGFATS